MLVALATVLEQLQTAIDKSSISIDRSAQEDWWRQIISWREQKCLSYSTDGDKIKPQAVIEAIYKATNGDAYVSSDVGQHQMFAACIIRLNTLANGLIGGLARWALVCLRLWVLSLLS